MERLGLLRPWLYALALGQPGREELACALRQGPVHGHMAPIEVDADPRGGSFTIMPGEAARALLLDESRGLSGRMNRPGQGLAKRLGADRSSSWLQILSLSRDARWLGRWSCCSRGRGRYPSVSSEEWRRGQMLAPQLIARNIIACALTSLSFNDNLKR